MKNSGKLKLTAILFVCLLLLSIALCACNNTVKNAPSFSCFGNRGEDITFDIKTKIQLRLPGPMAFKSDITDIDRMVEKMKAVSPDYDYTTLDFYGRKTCFIFNNSYTKPGTFMLRQIVDERYNYSLAPEILFCSFAQELAFPHRYMSLPVDFDVRVDNGSTFLVTCSLEQLSEFYSMNNYTVEAQTNGIKLTDNVNWEPYEGQTRTFYIEYTVFDESTSIIKYKV